MPRKCCVYECRTNYTPSERGTVFRFPNDATERNRWLASLPNKDLTWTEHIGICENHWPSDYTRKSVQGGGIQPTEPPTIFASTIPISCIPSPAPPKRNVNNTLSVRNQTNDELECFLAKDKINYDNFVEQMQSFSEKIICYGLVNEFCIVSKERKGALPNYTIYISTSTEQCECYFGALKLSIPFLATKVINKHSQLEAAIHYLSQYECDNYKYRS